MTKPTQSYLAVPYDLRPAKQVERRMMFDALQILARAGFDIGDYQYTGFGSIFFADFILFHRYLGLTRMLNVEHDRSIEKRIRFNQPFNLIELEFKTAAEIIPTLSRDRHHILWLDYDDYLRSWMIQDLAAALSQLSVGSILLLTVDVGPPLKDGGPGEWEEHFREEVPSFIPFDWTTEHFGRERLPGSVREILRIAINSALNYREGVRFLPLFSFLYADGHPMYTVGGMLGGAGEVRQMRRADFNNAIYVRRSLKLAPYEIRIPNLTKRERMYLEAKMPVPPDWLPVDFELSAAEVKAFAEIYRFYPNYAELL